MEALSRKRPSTAASKSYIMNPVQPKNKENEYHSMILPSAAPTKLPLTSCGLRTPRELPKETNGVGSPDVSLEASDFSKHNNLVTTIPGC
jgi:hypothetical protein